MTYMLVGAVIMLVGVVVGYTMGVGASAGTDEG